MNEPTTLSRWKSLAVEGLVIVASILLAFAIDAWWDQKREIRDAQDQTARVVAELRANINLLQGQDENLGQSTEAARQLLRLMGPDVEPISTEEVGSLVFRLFGQRTLSLSTSATQNFLSSGQLTEGPWIDVRLSLAALESRVQVVENNSLELRELRPALVDVMSNAVSGLDVVREHPVMAEYAPSRFKSDPVALMADMKFESLVSTYSIRMELNRTSIQELLDLHVAVVAMIEREN